MSPDDRPALAKGVRAQADPISGKTVLLYPEGMLELNPTGAAIVALCDGKRTFGDIVRQLATEFSAPRDVLRADVAEYLERLQARGLVGAPG